MKKRTIWRTLLVLVLCCSMVLNVFAAAEESMEVVDNGDGTTTVVTTTETTVTEEGKTIVTVTIQKDTTGTNEEQQTVTGSETYEETTVIERGMVREYDWTIDGSEVKEWTEEDTGDAEGQPEVSVELKPGETTVGTVTETTVTGSTPDGEDDPRYDYTTTTKTDREVTATTSEVVITVNKTVDNMTPVGSEDNADGSPKKDQYFDKTHYHYDKEAAGKLNVDFENRPEDATYAYVGSAEYSHKYITVLNVVYQRDEEGNVLYDEESGEPLIDYVARAWNPGYENRLKDADGNTIQTLDYPFTTGSRPVMFWLKDENGNYVTAYCTDALNGTQEAEWYSVSNLEDVDYYQGDAAKHVRAVVANGYWGTNEGTGSLDQIVANLKAAFENGEIEDYVVSVIENEDGTTTNVMASEIIGDMTEGEALDATQAAIWCWANRENVDDTVYLGAIEKSTRPSEESAARRDIYYSWLRNLDPVEDHTVVINEENFVEDLNMTIGDKVAGSKNHMNDTYETAVSFKLEFTPSVVNDDLLVEISYENLEGETVKVIKRLAGDDTETQFGSITPVDGVYTVEGLTFSENEDITFDLRIVGTQELEQGVYFYSPVNGREISQSMVGLAEGTRQVDISMSVSVSFDVEEENKFRSERKWHVEDPGFILDDDDDPSDPPTDPIDPPTDPVDPIDPPVDPVDPIEDIPEENVPLEDIPDEEIPLEDLPDEEVPLAAVPQTGDASVYFAILSALSGTGLAGLALTKKREEN